MRASQRRNLQILLYSRAPLIGGWLQRRAARTLARDGSPPAIQLLAQAICDHTDEHVQRIARQAMLEIETQSCIDAVCQVWAERRHPWLAAQIEARAWVAAKPPAVRTLSALQAGELDLILDGQASMLPPLVQACQDREAQLAARARDCLPRLRSRAMINRLCKLWADERAPLLEDALLSGGYIAGTPVAARVLSALKVGKIDVVTRGKSKVVAPLAASADDRDPQIAARARQALANLERAEAREQVCRLVIEGDHPHARQAALQGGYLPGEPAPRALFLLLTGQWQAYQALDFDQRLLRAAYQTAGSALRQRILAAIRGSGRADLLSVAAARGVLVQTPEEASFLVQVLSEHSEWARLWEKLFELPLAASLRTLHTLAGQAWQPEREDERAAMAELIALAHVDLEITTGAFRRSLPPALRRAHAHLRSGRINDLTFAPDRPVIAVGTGQRKVAEWNFQHGQREMVLGDFDHSIGEVAYCPGGSLVFSERTNSRGTCATYVHLSGETTRIWEHPGSATALEPAGENWALVASRNHQVALLDVQARRSVSVSGQLYDWPRAARVSPAADKAALLHRDVSLFSLPSLKRIDSTVHYPWKSGVLRCAAFSPDGQGLLLGAFGGQVLYTPLPLRTVEPMLLVRHASQVQGVEALIPRSVIVSAEAAGEVRFTGWANHATLGKINIPGERLTSLHISPDGSFMALGDSDASLSLWDLRVLDVPALLEDPLARSTPNQLAALDLLIERGGLPPCIHNALVLLERLLRYRFRFDIEISEVQGIKAGEYDIEIE